MEKLTMKQVNIDINEQLRRRKEVRTSEKDFIDGCKKVLIDHGLIVPPDLNTSGEIVRTGEVEKPHSKNGYYAIYLRTLTIHGGNWRTGLKFHWSDLSKKEGQYSYSIRPKSYLIDRAVPSKERYRRAIETNLMVWSQCQPVISHPYLDKKQIKPYFARQLKQKLVIPMMQLSGDITGLQFIDSNSEKRFHKGSVTKGACCPIGMTVDPVSILFCEGYATGCSLHEATGLPVVITFSATNLTGVAKAFHKKYPGRHLVICADNDHLLNKREGKNPGLTAAIEAYNIVGGSLCIPQFLPDDASTDFNDIHVKYGMDFLSELLSKFTKKVG
jgi:putative DNA primase/helicase